MALALQIMGGMLQVTGVIALAFGITQTRKAFLPDVDWWLARWWRALTGWVLARWRRWFEKGQTVELESLSAGVSFGADARLTKSYGSLPEDEAERWAAVEGRFAELIEGLQDVQGKAQDHEAELSKVRREIEMVRAELENQTEEHVRRLAASGLRTESWAVFLIGLGLALSTWGLILV